jgi:FtsX-like permease family
VKAWSTATLSDLVLNGHAVPALGIEPGRGAVIPSVVSGRMPRGPHEIALGGHTLRSLDRGVGDDVTVTAPNGHHSQLHVVARVVLPGTGTYSGSDKTALGEGAVVTRAALDRLAPKFTAHSFLVDFRNGGDRKVVVRQVRAVVHGDDPEAVTVQGVQRPSDIIEYGRVRNLPIVLAGVLALLAVATIAHALITSVRRRRRDYALFKTLGFTRRQVSSTVAWQATTVGMVALLVGLPAGVVLGRWGWHVLSDSLGTVAEPVVPLVGIAIAIPTVLLLANVVAFVPGRIAARLRPATVLRSE